jgi:hypothetical protein
VARYDSPDVAEEAAARRAASGGANG